jgi:homocysteine S-methyltransferase
MACARAFAYSLSSSREDRMDFRHFLASGAGAITDGAVLERLRRDPDLILDPHILHGGFVYDAAGRIRLAEIHRDYMTVARAAGLPILAFTDTWRCSRHAIDASRFRGHRVNEDNARFLIALRDSFGEGSPIFVGGLLGPSGDAYKPDEGLDRRAARAFHLPQVDALAAAGVDFLFLATAPNVEEALGVAMAEMSLPSIISFVIRRTGVVLDRTPLGEAMRRIDAETSRPPAGFAINCVHAFALESALEAMTAFYPEAARRILAFQANTSDNDVEELDGSAELLTEPAPAFAENVGRVRRRFGLRVVGGCCGTDSGHIEALARKLSCAEVST